MRSTLFLFLAQTRLFWKARNALSRFAFLGYRGLFGIRYRLQQEGATTKSLLSLLKLTLGDLVLALILATVLQVTNPYFVPWFTEQGFTIPEESDYGTLLATVIGVGGVFIGLYYAAISMVGGAIYARVPNNIRDLLAQERAGGSYMRFLAVFTFFGVCLLAFHSVGLEPIVLAVPLFLLSAGLAVIGFVRLGTRAFYLFDPTVLSLRLFEQLQRYYTQIQAGHYRWSDQSFQNHAHTRARIAVDTLATVSGIAARETHLNGRPFADLCKNLLSFLLHYETAKKSIPTDSLWYERRYEHPDWYRTDNTATSMAHQTATGLRPHSVNDSAWIESAILPILQRCLEVNIKERRYTIINELLDGINFYIKRLAEEHRIQPGFDLARNVFSWCQDFIFVKHDTPAKEEISEHMAICDRLALLPITLLVTYVQFIESCGQDEIRGRISQVTWKSDKSIYQAGFGVHVLKKLEYLRSRLEFEKRVEGRFITPSWYIQELVAQAETENLSVAINCFFTEAYDLYECWIETALSSQHPWLAAMMTARESEYCHKLHSHEKTLTQLWADLISSQRIEGLPWPSMAFDDLGQKSEQRQEKLLQTMATQGTSLLLMPRLEAYPDFAGQFLHATGETLLSGLCKNNRETVERLFKHYFSGNLLQYERLRPKEAKLDQQSQVDIKIAVAPLLDLMAVSGYAYLLSDYHDTPCLKEPIEKEWNEYLKGDRAKESLRFLAAAVSLTESAFELAHRGTNRTRWQQIVSNRLKDIERREVPWDGRGHIRSFEPIVMHRSPLVRIFARDGLRSFHDGIDIFLAKYIRQREDGKTLNFGRHRDRELEQKVEREREHYAEARKI